MDNNIFLLYYKIFYLIFNNKSYDIQLGMSNTTSVQKYLSKQKLMHLIITKDNSVAFINQSGKAHKSKVWLNYSTIFVDSTKQDYAMYNDCMILIAYKRNTGTGGMQKTC